MKNIIKLFLITTTLISILIGCSNETLSKSESLMKEQYGINKEITGSYDETLSAKCNNGVFVGKQYDNIISYQGIPYAQMPVGNLRWKAPVEPTENNKVYEAYHFGKSAIQTKTETERASLYEQGEDCLYLNLWSNKNNKNTKKPVMVFIHGGSYGWGGTSDPIYNGQNFVKENDDVILVTIAYRTGMMGFIDFSSIKGGDEYKDSCNLGILDQIMALKWVHNNIANFGGNPDNVTIFGESAGGGSVSILSVLPQAKGLFNRAIAESGSVALTYSKEECKPLTTKLLDKAKVKSMDDLMALSEDQLKELNESLNDYNNFPQRDGNIIPKDLYSKYEQGAGSNIDLLIGTTADEARYWIGEMGGIKKFKFMLPILYENNLSRITENDMTYVNKFMETQKKESTWNITEFYNELMFRIPAITQATNHSKNGGNTYMYYWTYPSAIENYGACHAVELAYVFNNLNETIYTGDNINKELAKNVQKMWVNFAKTGNPSIENMSWPQYDEKTRNTMFLGNEIGINSDPLREQRKTMEPLIKYNFNGCYTNLSLAIPYIYKIVGFIVIIITALIIGAIVLVKRKNNI